MASQLQATSRGITTAGAYIPACRIERRTIAEAHAWAVPDLAGRAQGQRAFANWDEDSLTMAVEAVRNALPVRARAALGRVLLASTTLPFADRHNAGVLAAALNLRDDLHSLDIGGCQRAATSALRLALDAEGADSVVVATECSTSKPGSAQELLGGDAAAAIVVGSEGVIARYVGATSLARDFVDRFRESGARYDYCWEERWVRDEGWLKIIPTALRAALQENGIAAADIRHLIVPIPDARAAQGVASAVGIPIQALAEDLLRHVGTTGAAHGLLMLAKVLEAAQPGELIALCGFGQGCDVLLFEATNAISHWQPRLSLDALIARGRAEGSYLKFMSFRNPLPFEWGMRAEVDRKSAVTAQYRNTHSLMGFVAERCRETGAVRFPRPAREPVDGASATLEDCPLADEPAHVVSHAADWLAYCPSPPARYGHVQFDVGARLMMEFADDAAVDIGMPLRMVFRIKDSDRSRGYRRYFWKATPVDRPRDGEAA